MSKESKNAIASQVDEIAIFETFFPPHKEYGAEHNLLVYAIVDAFRLAFVEGDDSELWWILCGSEEPHSLRWMLRLLGLDPQAFMEACQEREWGVDIERLRFKRFSEVFW